MPGLSRPTWYIMRRQTILSTTRWDALPYRERTWVVPLRLSREALHEVREIVDHHTAEHDNIGIRRSSVADPEDATRNETQGGQTR